jgi:alpha-tubulin suppressor-like RCC1 family protein
MATRSTKAERGTRRWSRGVAGIVALLLWAGLVPAVAMGDDQAALASSLQGGSVAAWGANNLGQLGDGTTTDRAEPVEVSGLSDVVAVDAGSHHGLALLGDGTVRAWGRNHRGQLGDGTDTNRIEPVPVSGLSGAVAVAADAGGGGAHSLALLDDGTVRAWGDNELGQLGDGTTTLRHTPVAVSELSQVVAIAGGSWHNLALLDDGTVRAWGENSGGQLGDGTTIDRTTPVEVAGLSGVVAVAAGEGHSLALLDDGTLRAWGWNQHGQVGDGTTTNRTEPVEVSALSGVVAIAAAGGHSLAVLDDGTVRAWGRNFSGQLGDGTDTDRRTEPVTVSGLGEVSAVAAGENHSLAVLEDSTARAWGNNFFGQLGDGATNTIETTPVTVAGLSGAVALAGGDRHSLALVATPASASLTATVTVAEPPEVPEACLLLSTATLDYGTLDLGASGTSPAYTVTSCSTAAQDLFSHATDAANADGSVTWALTAPPRNEDEFSVDANLLDDTGSVWLTAAASPMGSLAAEAEADGRAHLLEMPPAGSQGAGETMSFDVVWTAVIAEP